jgi:hypothetical protein
VGGLKGGLKKGTDKKDLGDRSGSGVKGFGLGYSDLYKGRGGEAKISPFGGGKKLSPVRDMFRGSYDLAYLE